MLYRHYIDPVDPQTSKKFVKNYPLYLCKYTAQFGTLSPSGSQIIKLKLVSFKMLSRMCYINKFSDT